MDLMQFALGLIEKNPNVANNPMAKEMVSVIRNNDSQKGEQIANNLLQTYGVSRDDAIAQAKKMFNL